MLPQEPVEILCTCRVHAQILILLQSQILPPAGLVRVSYIEMKTVDLEAAETTPFSSASHLCVHYTCLKSPRQF